MTRTSDVSPSGDSIIKNDLQARCNIANKAKADIFVSIHLNSGSDKATGSEVYYYKNSQNGKRLAGEILTSLVTSLDGVGLGLFAVPLEAQTDTLAEANRGIKEGRFYVLANTAMPACLVEVDFISNPEVEAKLRDNSFRLRAANGIAGGIFKYFGIPYPFGYEDYKLRALEKLSRAAKFNSYHSPDEVVDLGFLSVILERLKLI